MDEQLKVDIACAATDNYAVGQMAVAGIAGVCGELVRLGAFDAAAIQRIADFMFLSVERSVGDLTLRSVLSNAIAEQMEKLMDIAATAPNGTA